MGTAKRQVSKMPKIYIAVYRPRSGNYYHWAIYVKGTPPRVLEVTGSHPNFTRNSIEAKPESTDRHVESIKVGDVNEGDVREFYSIMGRVEVENGIARTTYWKPLRRLLKSACSTKMIKTINKEFGSQKGIITVPSEGPYVKRRMGPIPNLYASSRYVFLGRYTPGDINTNHRFR